MSQQSLYEQAHTHAVVFDLSHHGKVELTGTEVAAFLHNLCTQDIKTLSPGQTREAFFTTTKARVVAHTFIHRLTLAEGRDAFWIEVGPASAPEFLKHLDHFLISEDVAFTDRTRELALFHVAGPEAAALEPRLHDSLKDATCVIHGQTRLSVPGWDLLFPAEMATAIQQRLIDAGVQPAGQDVFNVLRVEAGMPAHGTEIDDTRLAMELGRTAQAICYTKGCYLGQETIVMARDRGHVNRTLLGLKLTGDEPAMAGAKVFHGEEEVGQVTSSVFSPRVGSALALAFLRRGHQQPGTRVEVESVGSKLPAEVAALPFVAV